jgi:hypothetical protein
MKNNKNKVLITILSLIGLMFTALLFTLTTKPNLDNANINQTTVQSPVDKTSPEQLVEANLYPFQIETLVGQEFAINLDWKNLTEPIVSADLILEFDPKLIEFVSVTEVNSNYLNPRTLNQNGRLILSFIQKQPSKNNAKTITMAKLNFKALSKGNALIVPVINNKANSSMVIGASDENLLSSINQVQITIE